MIESPGQWMNLARVYARANAGSVLPGMVHNLQNSVHAGIMQLDLWKQHLQQSAGPDSRMIGRNLTRLQTTTEDQIRFCQDLEQRSFYLQESRVRFEARAFCAWLGRFWINNLFFKHHVDLSLEIDPKTPASLHLPPMPVTLCLEEALKNAIEACLSRDVHGEFAFRLCLSPHEQGLIFSLEAATELPANLDPWLQGSTDKEGHLGLGLPLVGFLCRQCGWMCSLEAEDGQTKFRLALPMTEARRPRLEVGAAEPGWPEGPATC